jgi:hypothetical protein
LDAFLPGLKSCVFTDKGQEIKYFLAKRHEKNILPGQSATKHLVTGTKDKLNNFTATWT